MTLPGMRLVDALSEARQTRMEPLALVTVPRPLFPPPRPPQSGPAMRTMTLAALLTFAVLSGARGGDWPQWRGAKLNGVSSETGLPVTWSRTEHVRWRLPLASESGSTPAVWGDRLYMTTSDGDDLYVLGVSTAGQVLWKTKIGAGNTVSRPGEGDSGSPSPVTDGNHVWALFGTGQLACLTRDGQIVWNMNVEERYGKLEISFGLTSTPVLHGEGLYLQLIHGALYADYIVGKVIRLNKLTGKEVWSVDRPSLVKIENKHSYASPTLYDDGQTRFLISHGAECTVGHSLDDGRELWKLSNLNGGTELNQSAYDETLRFVATPVCGPGLIVVPTAKLGPVIGVRVNEQLRGAVTREANIAWVHRKTPDVCSPLLHEGLVYLPDSNGLLTCLDAQTGEQVYRERTHAADHRASPLLAGGHIYLFAKDGNCTVVQAGRNFKIAAKNDLGEPVAASPAVSNGVLYVRSFEALYALADR